MKTDTRDPYTELETTLPPAFARVEVPRLLGGLISAGRLANLDSEGLGPKRINLGRKVGYLRGDFISWMRSRAEAEKSTKTTPSKRLSRAGRA